MRSYMAAVKGELHMNHSLLFFNHTLPIPVLEAYVTPNQDGAKGMISRMCVGRISRLYKMQPHVFILLCTMTVGGMCLSLAAVRACCNLAKITFDPSTAGMVIQSRMRMCCHFHNE